MNTSKLADISEIVSSIAIVATLIYLTIQVQQNTEALHASQRQITAVWAYSAHPKFYVYRPVKLFYNYSN